MCDFLGFLCDSVELFVPIFVDLWRDIVREFREFRDFRPAGPTKQLGPFGHLGRPFSM